MELGFYIKVQDLFYRGIYAKFQSLNKQTMVHICTYPYTVNNSIFLEISQLCYISLTVQHFKTAIKPSGRGNVWSR